MAVAGVLNKPTASGQQPCVSLEAIHSGQAYLSEFSPGQPLAVQEPIWWQQLRQLMDETIWLAAASLCSCSASPQSHESSQTNQLRADAAGQDMAQDTSSGIRNSVQGGSNVAVALPRQSGPTMLLSVMAHATPYNRSKLASSVEVAVVGPQRSLPAAKDSRWPLHRAHLQARLPKETTEGILASSDGCLLEGFITNLFIISGTEQHPVLETAAEEEGVLGGIMRARVLQTCSRLCIPVKLAAPHYSTRHLWKGAFLTNSLRGLQQIHCISSQGAHSPATGSWRLELPSTTCISNLLTRISTQSPARSAS
ncbi:hypothetical protein WJX84_003050 [Apatococcus fuscideae]|uniref:Uncharacterized protein n=1 Tax=Apatococcus fuscideae TaxID=2026836 RepID=A0AAW1SKI4_9CHLO